MTHARFADAFASLAWVVTVDGRRHVSTYAHLPPRQRPEARCPVCERPVTLKLGLQRAHHAAHAPHDTCAVTHPETALHFNLKCHIAAELERAAEAGRPLHVVEWCIVGRATAETPAVRSAPPALPSEAAPEGRRSGGQGAIIEGPAPDEEGPRGSNGPSEAERWAAPCPERHERPWIERWDRVVLETRIGDERASRIPDVVLYLGDRVVGAVEVFHSHAVDREKAAALAALDVPWAEVRADPALLAPETAWTADAALPTDRVGPAGRWRCPEHAAAEAARREAARHTTCVRAAKVVDLLYPSGKVYRNVYRVVEHRTDGRPTRITLEADDRLLLDETLDDLFDAPRKRALWDRIRERVARDVRGAETHRGARTDSAMDWARGRLAERIAREAAGGWWDRVPLERTHPLRWRFARASGEWFRPRDLRDVDWTRPDDDPLRDPHPAFHRPHPSAGRQPGGADASAPPSEPAGWRDPDPEAAYPPVMPPSVATRRPPAPEPSAWAPAEPVVPADLGPLVCGTVPHPAAVLCELRTPPAEHRTVVVALPVRGAAPAAIRDLDRQLAAGVDRLWLSRRNEWTRDLIDVPWLEVFCAADGTLFVSTQGHDLSLPRAAEWFVEGVIGLDPPRVLAARQATRLSW